MTEGEIPRHLRTPKAPARLSEQERKEDLELIKKTDQLFREIIFQKRLGTRMKFFIGEHDVYGGKEGAWDKIQDEIDDVRRLDRVFGPPNEYKYYADYVEKMVVIGAAMFNWVGSGTRPRLAAPGDDKRRATDGSLLLRRSVDGEPMLQSLAFNTTSFAGAGVQKVSNMLRFIESGRLGSLIAAQSLSEDTGMHMKGRQDLVPQFPIVISHRLAAEIAALIDMKDYAKVTVHPIQLMLIEQLSVQAKAYKAFAEERTKGFDRAEVLNIFSRIETLLDAIYSERKGFLEQYSQNTDRQDIRDLLESGVQDVEHEKFIALFKKSGYAQARRLDALRVVKPPLKRNPAANRKEPMPVWKLDPKTKKRERIVGARYQRAMRGRKQSGNPPGGSVEA